MSEGGATRPVVEVVAGVILQEGRVLLSRRPAGTHLGGLWEFPGGKMEAGESPEAALARELEEELGIQVTVGEMVARVEHRYPERHVALRFFRCALRAGTPRPLEVAAIRWVPVEEVASLPLPPADAPVVQWLLQHRSGKS